ncbi:MAG: hypothetical protein L0H93_04635 [Nocardioides sp.]|nr:hypothetical protein [Nocardioides sp.]
MHGLQALVLGFLTLAGPLSLGPTTLTLLVSYLTILIALCSTPDDYLWAALVPILGLPATPAGSAFLQSEETATASWPLLTAAAVCATLTAVTLAARRTRGLPWLRPSGS